MSKYCNLQKSILCFTLVLVPSTFFAPPSLQAQEKSDSANKIGNNPSGAIAARMTLAPPVMGPGKLASPASAGEQEKLSADLKGKLDSESEWLGELKKQFEEAQQKGDSNAIEVLNKHINHSTEKIANLIAGIANLRTPQEKIQDDIENEKNFIKDMERMVETSRKEDMDGKLSKEEAERLRAVEKSIEAAKIRIFDKGVDLLRLRSPEEKVQDKLRFAKESAADYERQLEQAKKGEDKVLIETFEKLMQSSKDDVTEAEAVLKNPNWMSSYLQKEQEKLDKMLKGGESDQTPKDDKDMDALLLKDAQDIHQNPNPDGKQDKDVDALLLRDDPTFDPNRSPAEQGIHADSDQHRKPAGDAENMLEEQRRLQKEDEQSRLSDIQNNIHEDQVVKEQSSSDNQSKDSPNCPM